MADTSLADLPNEVLDKIFFKLPNADLKSCSRVSNDWNQRIQTRIGFKTVFGMGASSSFGNRNIRRPAKTQPKLGFQSCKLGFIGNKGQIPAISRPKLLKSFTFAGPISQVNMSIILRSVAATLTSLTLNQFILLGFKNIEACRKNGKSWFSFPQLKSFTLTGFSNTWWGPRCGQSQPDRKWKQMIINIVNLLRKMDATQLAEIVLQSVRVQSSKQEDVIMENLWKLIIKNKLTLKKLSIGICSHYSYMREINSRLDSPLELPKLRSQLDGLQLSSLYVQNKRSGPKTRRTQKLLGLILEKQTQNSNLKNVVWVFHLDEVVHGFSPELVTRNERSLGSIEMMVPPDLKQINCQTFANCTVLKVLTLIRGNGKRWRNDEGKLVEQKHGTQLTQLQSLPSEHLKSLRILGLQIHKDELQFIPDNLHLEELELHDIDTSEDFGLLWKTFEAMLKEKTILFIFLDKCFNKPSSVEVEGDGFTEYAKGLLLNPGNSFRGLLLKLVDNQYRQFTWSPSRVYHQHNQNVFGSGSGYNHKYTNYFNNLSLQFPFEKNGTHFTEIYSSPVVNQGNLQNEQVVNHGMPNIPLVQENLDESESEESEMEVEEASSSDEEDEGESEGDSSSDDDEVDEASEVESDEASEEESDSDKSEASAASSDSD